MADAESFAHFIRRIRAGDAETAAQLLKEYESAIGQEVRLRLRDSRSRRLFDSMDICQSVLGSFFVRAAAGQHDLDQPEQLLKLLVAMVRNKVAYHARRHQAKIATTDGIRPLSPANGRWPPPIPVRAKKWLGVSFSRNFASD
jgi:hypothetical protein